MERGLALCGRKDELDFLYRVLEETRTDGARLVLLESEAGMGKSALVDAFIDHVGSDPRMLVLTSLGLDLYNTDPYLPFMEILEQLPSDEPPERERLERLPVPGEAEVPLSLLALMDMTPEENEHPQTVGREEFLVRGRNQLFETVNQRLLAQGGDRSFIIFINNIHWISNAAIDLLQYVFMSMLDRQLMVIGAARTEELGGVNEGMEYLNRFFRRLELDGRGYKLELGPINRETIREITCRYLSLNSVSEVALETLFSTTGGHPLFLLEVLEAVKKDPNLWNDIKKPVKGSLFHITVPKNLQEIFAEKLAGLNEDEKSVLFASSVLGREFDFRVIQSMLKMNEEKLIDSLDSLMENGFLVEVEGAEERYMFKRNILQDIIYSGLSKSRKRFLHKNAAKALERVMDGRIDNIYRLAEHYHRGRDYDKAFKYSLQAGNLAASSYANQEAVRYYDISLDSLDNKSVEDREGELRIKVLVKKGKNLDRVGQLDEAIDTFKKAIALAEAQDSKEKLRDLHQDLGNIYSRKGKWNRAIQSFETSLQLCRDLNDVRGMANAAYGTASVYNKKGEYPTAIEGFLGCIEMIEPLDEEEKKHDLAKFTRNLGVAYYHMGELQKAEECFQKSLNIYLELGDQYEVGATFHKRLGMIFDQGGDYSEAITYYKHAIAFFEKYGDIFQMGKNYISLGETYFKSGNIEEALENYKKAESIDRKIGNNHALAICLGLQGRAYVALDQGDKAMDLFNENQKICEFLGNKYGLAVAKRDIGILCYKLAKYDDSIREIAESVKLLDSIKSHDMQETAVLLNIVKAKAGQVGAEGELEKYQGTQIMERTLKWLADMGIDG